MFSVLNLERSKLGILFLCRPTKAAPSKANNAYDNENDANDSGWFHTLIKMGAVSLPA